MDSSLRFATQCHAVRAADFSFLGDVALDVSTDGLWLRSDAPAELGDEVFLTLRVPARAAWLDAEARVAAILDDGRGGRCLHLQILRMEAPENDALCEGLLDQVIAAVC